MTNSARAYAGDCRRAAAIAVHHGNRSVEGINALVIESKELGRGIELVQATHDVLNIAASAILTTRGMLTLHAAFRSVANNEDNPMRLSARFVVGLLDEDEEAVASVLDAAKDGLGTHLILSILKLYEDTVPLMFTPFSIEAFQATAATMFGAENGTDE